MNLRRCKFLKQEFEQGFPNYCGFKVKEIELGLFESYLEIQPEHAQQDGFVHAGVMATMADHTGGYAAYTTVSKGMRILTIEFKINYFKPAVGKSITCKSKVINQGKKIIVAESEIFSVNVGKNKLVSKATITLMAVPHSELVKK